MQKIELDLGNPNFTLLHRAGLAGLWMTLEKLEGNSPVDKRPGGLSWELDSRQVKLSWEGNDLEVLDWLLKASFQLDDGTISLTGLDAKTMDIQNRLILHQGILGTLLQHNQTHKSSGKVSKSFKIDDDLPEMVVQYKALTSYIYQDFAKNLCEKQGAMLKKPIKVPGWLNPGAVVRHNAFSNTSFEEEPKLAFVLLFASIACCYYILKSKLRDKRAQYALVIPEVVDLQKYASYRQQPKLRLAGYEKFQACGLGDAALRFLTYDTTANLAETYEVESCQVVTLGTVSWSAQQKTRTDLYGVVADAQTCATYRLCQQHLGNRLFQGKKGTFVASSFAREIIAENLAKGQPWYAGLADIVNSNELFQKLTYERGGLYQMVQKSAWDKESKKLFVRACHQAIRSTYGKAAGKATDGKKEPNFERENIKIRTGLSRCKNADSFRGFMADFWSRAGYIPILQEHWEELMDFMTGDENWKEARDLALLALASYKKQEPSEAKTDKGESDYEGDEDDEQIDIGL